MNNLKRLFGLDIPHKSLKYKNVKMAVIDSIFFYLRIILTHTVYQYHIDPFLIGAHFN
jgi:hypothetical protein